MNKQIQGLEQRWNDIYRVAHGMGESSNAFRELIKRYSERHRAYHNLSHLEQCFAELDPIRDKLADPISVEFALWFHDIIYSVYVSGNERKSAVLWSQHAKAMNLKVQLRDRVATLILATERHEIPKDDLDGRIFLDIDMSILGADPQAFNDYELKIRREFSWVPTWYFLRKRRSFLESLLRRNSIYLSTSFQKKFECQARNNIEHSLSHS